MKNIIRFFRKITTIISPKLTCSIMYYKIMGKKLNIKKPQTFNEKINYLKLFVYPNNDLVIKCTDKLLVREYIKDKGLGKYLVKSLGNWNSVEEIDFNNLPNKFVLKCNHGCGYNIICKNKDEFNENESFKIINKWMREDFGLVSGEPHYSKINRKIICEEFLANDILDYKFFCFKGKPQFFYISKNVDGDFHNMQADFFYPDGEIADFYRTDHKRFHEKPQIPNNLDEMLSVASKLSEDFEFVRVDLYNIDGKIYFSELTFSPCSGYMPILPQKYDYDFGKLISLGVDLDD